MSEAMEGSEVTTMSPVSAGTANASNSNSTSLYDYETQLFGFTPVTLLNGMFNTVCDFYREALKAFCTALHEKYPGVMSEEELKKARHAVSQEIDKEISEVFDKLEIFAIRYVFAIPEDCVLPEDACQLTFNSSADGEMDRKIQQLKKRIIAIKYANACLVKQLEHAESFKAVLDKLLVNSNDPSSAQAVNVRDVLSYLSDTVMPAFRKSKKS